MVNIEAASSPQDDGRQALEAGLRKQPVIGSLVLWFGAAVAVLHLVMNFTTLFST